MVLGFGEGGINLQLNKTNFAFGETAEGTLSLKLKKEKKARQLRVSVTAERQMTQYGTSSGGGIQRSSEKNVLFKTDVILDGEKTYSPPGKDYQFKIQVPLKTALPPEVGGKLGTAIKAVQVLGGQMSQVKWFMLGTLDVPGGRDINKKVQISVQ